MRTLHLAFARPLCLLERPTGAIHCFRNRKTFERSLVLFKGFLLSFQKSFFCLSAWRSHIVPYRNRFCKPFLHFFAFFCALYTSASFLLDLRWRFGLSSIISAQNSRRTKSAAAVALGFSSFLPVSSPAGSARQPPPASAARRSDQWAWVPAHYNRYLPG